MSDITTTDDSYCVGMAQRRHEQFVKVWIHLKLQTGGSNGLECNLIHGEEAGIEKDPHLEAE